MGINEALKILGLNNNYTEEELKKTYRKLIAKYHPDKYQGDKIIAENKTKQLNEAREILEKNLNNKNRNNEEYWNKTYQREFNLLYKFKQQYKEEMYEELEYINSINLNDKIFGKWKERFVEIIQKFYNCIDSQPNTISIVLNYTMYREEYYELLSKYINNYCNACNLVEIIDDNLKLDKTTSLKSVRGNITIIINELLSKELDKFKIFDCYNKIEPLLLEVRNGYTTLCIWGYLDIQTLKKDFKNDVMDEIIKYNERKQKIDDLIEYQGYLTPLEEELYNSLPYEEEFKKLYNMRVSKSARVKIKLKKIFSK